LGSVSSSGTIEIKIPRKKLDDYKEGSVIINGNVYAKNIEINGPAIIRGNLIVEENIVINKRTQVLGIIHSHKGKARLRNTFAYAAIIGNAPKKIGYRTYEEDIERMQFGLETGNNVSFLYPFIWIKRAVDDIKIKSPIRICDSSQRNPHIYNTVELTEVDAKSFNGGTLISRNWRSFREPHSIYEFLSLYLDRNVTSQKNFETYENLFEEDEAMGYATIDDTGTKIITQHIKQEYISGDKVVGEKIMGDKVRGDKVSIKDSVVTRSKIGGRRDKKEKGERAVGAKIKIQDSVMTHSNIGWDDEKGVRDYGKDDVWEPKKRTIRFELDDYE